VGRQGKGKGSGGDRKGREGRDGERKGGEEGKGEGKKEGEGGKGRVPPSEILNTPLLTVLHCCMCFVPIFVPRKLFYSIHRVV